MKFVVSVRTKLVTVMCIVAFFMIAVVSSAALTDKRLNKVKNHFESDELKVQGITAEQWASASIANPKAAVLNAVSGEKPKMASKKRVLHTLVAAAVIGGANTIYGHNDDDPAQVGGDQGDD